MSLTPVAVGYAQAHYGTKYSVAVGKTFAGTDGWNHVFTFEAFNAPIPNTVPMCIGNTSGDWRHIVKWGDNAAGNGWSHTGCIYVYPTPQPGTVPFTVSHQEGQWRWRISKGNGLQVEDIQSGWKQDFMFYAFPENSGESGARPPAISGNFTTGGHYPSLNTGGGRPPAHGGAYPPHSGGNFPPNAGGHFPPNTGGRPPAHGGAYPPNTGGQFPPSQGGYNPGAVPPSQGVSFFYIVSPLNGLCIGTDKHNDLIMVHKTNTSNCLWRWQGDSLVNKLGMAMEVEGSSRQEGARVLVEPFHGGLNQKWNQDGPNIVSKISGHVLDIYQRKTSAGSKVKMWSRNIPHTKNQTWMFEYHN